MKKFMYGILFMIGLRRTSDFCATVLFSPPVRNFVEDLTYRAVNQFLFNDKAGANQRLRQRTRRRTQTRVHSVPDPEAPYDHEAEGL